MEDLGFVVAAGGLLVMAVQVVAHKSPLRSALALIAALCFQAGLYVLLSAPFVAAMQILVYAGAIMVLFLFVIMLLNLGQGGGERDGGRRVWLATGLGVAGTAYLVVRVVAAGLGSGEPGRSGTFQGPPPDGSVRHIGELLLTDYLLSFEAISVVLLVAVVGSVVLGMRRLT